jgi:cytochrome c
MKQFVRIAALAVTGLGLLAAPALADSHTKAGEKVFKTKCKSCHNVDSTASKTGPGLLGLFGRKAGTLEEYASKYSDSMKAHGVEWNAETLAVYLEAPKKVVPGAKMNFAGFKVEKEKDKKNLDDLIVYLEAATKPKE